MIKIDGIKAISRVFLNKWSNLPIQQIASLFSLDNRNEEFLIYLKDGNGQSNLECSSERSPQSKQ